MKKLGIMFRATVVVAMVSALAVGATFALGSQAMVNNNTYTATSNTDGIVLAKNKDGQYSSTINGFDFGNLQEGEGCSDYEYIYMTNETDTSYDVAVSADYMDNTEINEKEVMVHFERGHTGQEVVYSLYELKNDTGPFGMPTISTNDNGIPGDYLDPEDDKKKFKVCVELNEGALRGDDAESQDFDLIFTGAPQEDAA